MPIIACYDMRLYCKNDNKDFTNDISPDKYGHNWDDKGEHIYTGSSREHCMKQARQNGWVFHRDGEVSCPKCSGKIAPAKGVSDD